MPIYEYRCEACGHEFETIQKMSEDPLVDCPECKQPQLKKLISAAAFRLKGGGWYETDFKSSKQKNLSGGGDSQDKSGASGESAKGGASGESTGTSKEGASGSGQKSQTGGGESGKSSSGGSSSSSGGSNSSKSSGSD